MRLVAGRAAFASAVTAVAGRAAAAGEDPPALADPGALTATGARGAESESWFADDRGEWHAFVPTYEAWVGSRRKPNYGRAALEEAVLLGLGTSLYWVQASTNKEDWDDPGLVQKLTFQAVTLDSNHNTTNHLLHPGGGAAIYLAARVNGVSVPVSLAYSAAGSVLWEFVLEWREQASINDMLYTVGGGLSLGEFFFQLGEYLNSAPGGGTVGNRIAAYTLGLPRALHSRADHEHLPPPLPVDSLGLSSAYDHAFRVAYESVFVTNNLHDEGTLNRAALDAEIVAMPGYHKEGAFAKYFGEGNFTELHLRLAAGSAGEEADVRADATLAGYYSQRFENGRSGHGEMIGIGSAWRFQQSRLLGRRDQLSALHIVGPHLGLWLVSGAMEGGIMADAHADFASLRSLAFDAWRAQFGSEGVKTVLAEESYTYQLGGSARVRGIFTVGPLSLGGRVEYGRYGSIEGLDRKQSALTRDVHDDEWVLEMGAAARAVLSNVAIGVGYDERWRKSTMGSVSVDRWDRFAHVSLGFVF
jgi:hypothetical protein